MPATSTVEGPPVWRQYQRFKRQHPGALLLFRIGDFYETFDDDAQIVARELEIVLTSREMGKGRRHPLAGIPHHALDAHLARLVARGHRVAICEQTSDPATSPGLVERTVLRVVTPGTIAEPQLLEAKVNNYLAAVCLQRAAAGLAYVDVTTGEFVCCQLDESGGRPSRRGEIDRDVLARVVQELQRIGAAEVLVPADDPRAGPPSDTPPELTREFLLTPYEAWRFAEDLAVDRLRSQYRVATLDGFGCRGRPLAVRAAGALLQYVADTAPGALAHLRYLRTQDTGAFVALDAATRRNLELTTGARGDALRGSLLGVLDRNRTPMGGRLLRSWLAHPLLDRRSLEERLDAVELLFGQAATRSRLGVLLGRVADLERLTGRVVQGAATPRELIALGTSLATLPELRAILVELADGAPTGPAARLAAGIRPIEELAELIGRAIVPDPPPILADGGVIAPGYASELDDLVASTRGAREWMATLERRERERTGLRGLRVGYNKVFGYYVEVSTAALRAPPTPEILAAADQPPATVQAFLERQCGYLRKQTLVGAERYVTPELKEKEQLIVEAQERIVALERRLYEALCQRIGERRDGLLATAAAVAQLDVSLGLADVAAANRYVRPRLTDGDAIEIVAGRHPVVELSAIESGFVPNDTRLASSQEQIAIVTGPNMAGKSTYLRQVGLIVLMAQIGSFVPAVEATIGLVDRIFTRVGAQDDIATGQSTFMVEMAETANILHHATPRSLVILDEIGRGTSTYDGMAIARAIVEYLHDHHRLGCKTLFATHYHELTELERTLARVRNFRVDVLEDGDRVVFLHRVVPGGADRSYGIYVAQLAGIPDTVTQRARALLRDLEGGGRARRTRAGQNGQAGRDLFDRPRDPMLDDLANLDPDGLTPLQALNKLYEICQRAREIP